MITSSCVEELIGSKVWQLLKNDQKEWDMDIVGNIFNESDQQSISSVPFSVRKVKDNWIWVLDPKFRFSVKSVYTCLRGELETVHNSDVCRVWNSIWNMNIPLGIINFMWRLLSGYLPTYDALASKHVSINALCRVVSNPNVTDWVCSWMGRCKKEESELISMVCWRIWLNINDMVRNGKSSSVDNVINSAGVQLFQWQRARGKVAGHKDDEMERDSGAVAWKKPEAGWFKVNVDAAVFEREGGAGLGCVVRDDEGMIIQARHANISGNFYPRTAEIMGIREALSWLKGWRNIIIESDALEVIMDIRNAKAQDGDLLIDDCVFLAKQFPNLVFDYVRRSANQVAHCLAHNARFLSGHQEWFSDFPDFLTSVTVSNISQ
ncbi:uncharacterized protein LOC126687911 [Mercurialis annua]|uniref:uncharacterized protein LOC126687911 n=1 Tax=Mercurialis annua TaxID=3986 RepID=UPI00215EF627|nr:uncharacterized protein LOC126687911 [Mercurialis annua]